MSSQQRLVRRGAAGIVIVVVAVLIDQQAWRWPSVRSAAMVIDKHPALFLGSLVVAALLTEALIRRRAGSTRTVVHRSGTGRWPWLLADQGLAVVVGTLTAIGVIALVVMLRVADAAPVGAERAKLTIEAIKYGLGSIAAAGAAAALLLAVRRQRHAEQIHEHTVDDAAERRVTDLYTKAVEQLGHADAAVRLGGLYALERVAQNNPRQRQTIVNVLCAYLRMPYTPPPATDTAPTAIGPTTDLPMPRTTPAPASGRDAHQELQVRLTAQRILTTHLTAPPEVTAEQADRFTASADLPFWPNIELDLTGATLIDWSWQGGHIRHAIFTQATFTGVARFVGATFTDAARFDKATFTDAALFAGATFTGHALFAEAAFTGHALFDKATFTDAARFDKATFTAAAWFEEVTFTGGVSFDKATFTDYARFGQATFTDYAQFSDVTFTGDARFSEATFTDNAWFDQATFTDDARFDQATFTGDAQFSDVTFTGDARFDQATFTDDAWFDEATFTGDARFDQATFGLSGQPILNGAVAAGRDDRKDVWPSGWYLIAMHGAYRLVREDPVLQPESKRAEPQSLSG